MILEKIEFIAKPTKWDKMVTRAIKGLFCKEGIRCIYTHSISSINMCLIKVDINKNWNRSCKVIFVREFSVPTCNNS